MKPTPREYTTLIDCWEDGCTAQIAVVTHVMPFEGGVDINTDLSAADLHMVEHGYEPIVETLND
jgi:hypothetical protein